MPANFIDFLSVGWKYNLGPGFPGNLQDAEKAIVLSYLTQINKSTTLDDIADKSIIKSPLLKFLVEIYSNASDKQ